MSRRAALQTYHALQASELAAAVNEALKKVLLGPGDYSAELTEPQGPSTAGGVQAMQHLRLVPRLPDYPTLVAGHANQADKSAELRSYAHLDAVHRARFKRPLDLDRAGYDEFVNLAKGLLEALQFRTRIAGPPADLEGSEAPRAGRSSVVVVGSVVVVLALIALGVWQLAR